MALWDYIKSRLTSLNRTEADLTDEFGISTNTLVRIRTGGEIRDNTKQKLALALGCCIGDINAAIAQQDPVEPKGHDMEMMAKETGEPAVMETMAKPVPMPDYPATEAKPVPMPDYPATEAKPVPIPDYPATEAKSLTLSEYLAAAEREAVDDYKRKLKDICLRFLAETPLTQEYYSSDLFAAIGKALVKELMEDGQGAGKAR